MRKDAERFVAPRTSVCTLYSYEGSMKYMVWLLKGVQKKTDDGAVRHEPNAKGTLILVGYTRSIVVL